jgi:N,N'-diacetyllegionaminate synthase
VTSGATMSFHVGDRAVGPGEPVFVIAEAGVNHNGDVRLARELIDAARDTGADAVKFQTWVTDLIVTKAAPAAEYQIEHVGETTQADMLRALELPSEAFGDLKQHADRRGIVFLSTPDDPPSAKLLVGLGVPALKIGSGEVTNLRYLEHIGTLGKPVILSTGMADLAEVREAVAALRRGGCAELALLHCVSAYPAPVEEANLAAMQTLRSEFNCVVGFSDHTIGTLASVAAVAMGASIIEKHLTLDRSMAGPDHAASMEPADFASMVRDIRAVEAARGDGRKAPRPSELSNREVVRRVLVTARDLAAGHTLAPGDLVGKRAGAGISIAEIDAVMGRRLTVRVRADEPLRPGQLA